MSISGGGNILKKILTIRYLLAIAILIIPLQGSMAAGCELPSSNDQAVIAESIDHGVDHQPSSSSLEQHSCCDEETCPEMDSYCGSCMNFVSLTNEIEIFARSSTPELHNNTSTHLTNLAPPPPTKPPV